MRARRCLILASASPRRLELLRGAGLDPRVVVPRVDETVRPGEAPEARVARLAIEKVHAVELDLAAQAQLAVVLGADTEVVLDGRPLGKPRDAVEAAAMLRALRGRVHEVLTGVHLLRRDEQRSATAVAVTRVRFRSFDDATLAAYVATGEPLDKAGAYGIQGHGASLVESVDGSWSNVVGLPVEQLPAWLERIGLRMEDLAAES